MTLVESFLVAMVSGGLAGAVVRYFLDIRKQRLEFAMKLHEEWWKQDFRAVRTVVYEVVEDLDRVGGPGPKYIELLGHY